MKLKIEFHSNAIEHQVLPASPEPHLTTTGSFIQTDSRQRTVPPGGARISKLLTVLLCMVFISAWANDNHGDSSWRTPAPFGANDRWGVLGDSITQGCHYHCYIELFYLTRFPDRKIEAINCGIAGDTATGALQRLDWDCLAAKPTVVSVMFGMNDLGRDLYNGASNPEIEAQRDLRTKAYRRAMEVLTKRLLDAGVRVILIKPSIYDDTAELPSRNYPGCGSALAGFAGIVQDIADKYQVPTVDCNTPMAAINKQQEEYNPHFSIVGPDRVHPTLPGSFVMAYEFIHQQLPSCAVSRIAIDASADKIGRLENCEITNLKVDTNSLSFTCLESGLPFPIEAAARPALRYVPFATQLNQETFLVRGLTPGNYELSIDGARCCIFTAAQLADGVNLADENTPQLEQSFRVLAALERKWKYTGELRIIAFCEHFLWRQAAHPVDFAGMQKKLAVELAKTGTNPWIVSQLKQYRELKPQEAELHRQVEMTTHAAWLEAQPHPHEFALLRVAARTGKSLP